MSDLYPFQSQLPHRSSELVLSLISLEEWCVVSVSGADALKYLNSQLTADLDALKPNTLIHAGHCDAKGKMWSNLQLFKTESGFAYIVRQSVAEKQLAELKKYAVFSKVTIAAVNDKKLLGIAGKEAASWLANYFSVLPDTQQSVVQQDGSTLLYLARPAPRFVLITEPSTIAQLLQNLPATHTLNSSNQWLTLDIEAGMPVIDLATTNQFIPQAANLEQLGALSFTKGCYTGQEMVARAKYRGANKRAMYWLTGNSQSLPAVGDELELKLGENWRQTGTVLAAVKLNDGTLFVQAVLNNDLTAEDQLRVKDDATSALNMVGLVY